MDEKKEPQDDKINVISEQNKIWIFCKKFFDGTTAHGFKFLSSSEFHVRIGWLFLISLFFSAIYVSIVVRLETYLKAKENISYAFKLKHVGGLDVPSLSICTQNFQTGFILDALPYRKVSKPITLSSNPNFFNRALGDFFFRKFLLKN